MSNKKLTCEKARNISIVKTLENLGHLPTKKSEKEAWFLSPFRSETQASFKVDLRINRWYDHGAGKGGNIIDLIMNLRNLSVTETLAFLSGNISVFSFHKQPDLYNKRNYSIQKIKKLEHPTLIKYLISRKIKIEFAKTYCKEIYYQLNGSKYFSIAFENKIGGYEIRNEYFKGCLGSKYFSHIKKNSETLIVFEGFMDFLSYLTLGGDVTGKNEDYLILNSLSQSIKAESLFNSYEDIRLFWNYYIRLDKKKRDYRVIKINFER